MSDLDITTHQTGEFTEEGDCEADEDCITQATWAKRFCSAKLTAYKTVKYVVGLMQEMEPDFWISDPHAGYFVLQRLKPLE